ncbi:hypothetical protein PENTCL1PPCAC_19093, partial [Pristionchus entomophagus]
SDSARTLERVMIAASIMRLYHALTIIFLYCAAVVERICATLFMHNYELKSRIHIGIILSFSVICISFFFALELTYASSAIVIHFYLLLQYSQSFQISFYLYFYNRYRLKHVLKRVDSYSLSLRYQLIENMRAFRFLQTVTAVGVCGITITCLVLYVPQYFLKDKLSSNSRELCGAAFDTMYALAFCIGCMLFFFSQPVWRKD